MIITYMFCIIIAYTKKGNNSSVKGSILMKLIEYRESMVLIIYTKNRSILTNSYWDMVPDGQSVDGQNGRTTPKLYPSYFVGDKNSVDPVQLASSESSW